ncbi:MAG: hypothetical protein U0U67_07135 [Chitinophagales bacterium]
MTFSFDTSDVFVMQAINSGNGLFSSGVTLDEIIEFVDATNKSILRLDELNEALAKLLTIGFIKIHQPKFYVTDIFKKEKRKHCKRTSDRFKEFDEIKKMLSLYEKNDYYELIQQRISEDEYDIALKTYRIKHR